ncbi:MAG: hypothetical protein PHU93_04395 [Candidatus Gracilibacteria bacterium]|nr:hypothetical protein [Candidatus Gracilibacteria bacterium]
MNTNSTSLQNSEIYTIHEPRPTERFFNSVIKKVEEAAIRTGTRTETKELILMITEMRYRAERTAIILGTKGEQQAFLERIESLLVNPGEYNPSQIKENLQAIITEEFSKGITRAQRLNLSLGIDLIRPSDIDFNFPALDNYTTIVPMELHLAFYPNDTVQFALDRVRGQYANRGFNAVILMDTNKIFRGMITTISLERALAENPKMLLGEIPLEITESATLNTPKQEIEEKMLEHHVNIWAIKDTKSDAVIGILTHENVTISEVRIYTAQLDAQVKESLLKNEINKSNQESSMA